MSRSFNAIYTAQVITTDKNFASQLAFAITHNPNDTDIFEGHFILTKGEITAYGIDAICEEKFANAIEALNDENADHTDARFNGIMNAENLTLAREKIIASYYQCFIDGEYHDQPEAFENLANAHGYAIQNIQSP